MLARPALAINDADGIETTHTPRVHNATGTVLPYSTESLWDRAHHASLARYRSDGLWRWLYRACCRIAASFGRTEVFAGSLLLFSISAGPLDRRMVRTGLRYLLSRWMPFPTSRRGHWYAALAGSFA